MSLEVAYEAELCDLTCNVFVFSDHWDDLQYGPVLCHQEQQGGYIDGELIPSPPTNNQTRTCPLNPS